MPEAALTGRGYNTKNKMKNLFFSLLSFLVLLPAMAEQRTDSEMRSLAAEAINQLDGSRQKVKARTAAQLKVLRDMDQLTLFGYSDAGWAIVSKDDAYDAILGYSDKALDMSNPSPEFLWILNGFNVSLQQGLKDGTASSRRQARSKTCSVLREVKPLLKTEWSQGWPYNTKCPTVMTDKGLQTSVTGCVATAFAQVLYYHRLPQKYHGKKSYTWTCKETKEEKVLTYDFEKTPIDWANLVDTYYEGKSTKAQIDAIGNFMYACGVMSNMGYSPSGSGAAPATTSSSINNLFEDVISDTYGYYQPTQGRPMDATLVARELNEKRPLVFSGSDKNGENGHCFVIDGANAKGLLHCNLGWGGGGDGYYAMDDMCGYPTYQTLSTVIPCVNISVAKPCTELAGKTLRADTENPVTTLQPNVWYMMWNEGRSVATHDLGKGYNVGASGFVPDGRRAEYHAATVVRLIPNADGSRYAIQTGLGNYLPAFSHNATAKAGTTAVNYTIATIEDNNGVPQDGHFYLLTPSNVRLDCNGSFLVGWNTGATHEVGGNASWQFFPVEVKNAEKTEPITSIDLSADTIRTIAGCTFTIPAEVLPATASVPYINWSSSKSNIASVNNSGYVEAVAKGTAVISAAAVDGSDITSTVTVMVGSVTHTQKIGNIMFSSLYLLQNAAGTGGYLVACDTVPGHPVLRGITSKSTAGCKDDLYWEDAPLGDANTLWQILQDNDGNYYLFNIGAQKFLVNGDGEETEYVFSDQPKPYTIKAVTEEDFTGSADFLGHFYLNAGTTDSSRLMAGTNFLNPAHWLDSTTAIRIRQSVWKIQATSGLNKGLKAWSKEEFLAFLNPDGIETNQLSTVNSQLSTAYDLQGRTLRFGALSGSSSEKGILILNGQKIIR